MRAEAVLLAEKAATILIWPLVAAHRLHLVSFRTVGETLSLVPGPAGMILRRAWYRQTLDRCGPGLSVALGALLHEPGTRVGSHCHVGAYSLVGLADIGDDVLVASHCEILSGRHPYGTARGRPMRAQYNGPRRVTIGSDVWIGAGVLVGADVPDHSVVATGAVVVHDIGEVYSVIGGVPARRLGQRV